MNDTPPPGQISMPGMPQQQPPQFLRDYAPQTPLPGQISMPRIALQPPSQQVQQGYAPPTPMPLSMPGYSPQQPTPPPPGFVQQPLGQLPPMPQPARQKEQEVKFYKSGMFRSAAGQFERDYSHMLSNGWRILEVRPIGLNRWLQTVTVVVYER